jgi:hypothetical protein
MSKMTNQKSSNLLCNLDIDANNFANVYMILDPLSGDVIKANGRGNLVMKVGTTQDLVLTGRYEIDRGAYNFTFQSFIHKPFILSEGVGNYIQWNGNPYDATIGIQACIQGRKCPLQRPGTDGRQRSGHHQPECAALPGRYPCHSRPDRQADGADINFQIDLPPNSPLKNDQDALTLLQRIQSDENELNKQVSCLVVLNSFVPLSSSTNTFDASSAAADAVVSSISGV